MDTDSHPTQLPNVLLQCWELLRRGCSDRRFGFHHPVVATVDANGLPKSRVVILREADAARKILRFNADIRTRKWQELTSQPAISLVFYDEIEKTQLRIEGRALLHTGNETAKQAWNASQLMSRVAYGVSPGPGTEITSPEYANVPVQDDADFRGIANFGTIEVQVQNIEWLYLKVRGNRRAMFDLRGNTAQWLVP